MSNRVNYTQPGTGTPIATEEISIETFLQQLQIVKVGMGSFGGYQGDLSFGQAIAASSVPVVITTDQMYTATPSPTGNNQALLTRVVGPVSNYLGQKATYMSSSDSSVTMSASGTTSIGYLWHDGAITKRTSVQKILVSFAGGASGTFNLFVNRISAENITPSGVSQTITKQDLGDPNSSCVFRTNANAPTRDSGNNVCMVFGGGSEGYVDLVDILEGKGFICRSGQAEGWEVRGYGTGLSTPPNIGITFVWTES